jgi:uncharacterized membrane protein
MDTNSIVNACSDTLTGQLTSEQLFALKMKTLEMQRNFGDIEDIVVPSLFFLSTVAILIICLYFSNKNKKRRFDLIEKAIDKGQQIPDISLLTTRKQHKEKSVFDYVKNGIIFTLLGIVMLLYGIFNTSKEAINEPMVFIGSFFLAFGFAWLLIAIIKKNIDRKKNGN